MLNERASENGFTRPARKYFPRRRSRQNRCACRPTRASHQKALSYKWREGCQILLQLFLGLRHMLAASSANREQVFPTSTFGVACEQLSLLRLLLAWSALGPVL